MVQTGAMIQTPDPKNASFAHLMLTLALDNQVAKIYPLHRAELTALQEAQTLFAEFDIELLAPDNEFITD